MNPDIPAKVDEITSKCLEKDRNLRYQHASEIRADLQRLKRDTESGKTAVEPVGKRRQNCHALPKRRPRWSVLVLLATGAALLFRHYHGEDLGVDSIAVLPITDNDTSANGRVLEDGITSSLIDSLSQMPNLRVMSRSSVAQYKGKEVDPIAVGRQLNVKAVVTGQLVQQGDNIDLSVEMVNAHDDSHIWGKQYSRKASEILSLQQELARNVSARLMPVLSNEARDRLAKQGTSDPEAYQLYVQGSDISGHADGGFMAEERALEYFQKAVARDANYAAAYAGMAHAYVWLGFFLRDAAGRSPAKATDAATKAVQLDDSLAEAHAALGYVFMFNWEWQRSEKELRRALALNPSFAQAHLSLRPVSFRSREDGGSRVAEHKDRPRA